jgi:hypothetical protein
MHGIDLQDDLKDISTDDYRPLFNFEFSTVTTFAQIKFFHLIAKSIN